MLTHWEAYVYQFKLAYNLTEPKILQSHKDFVPHRGTTEWIAGECLKSSEGFASLGRAVMTQPGEGWLILAADVQLEAI